MKCENEDCYNYGKGLFYCNCLKADRLGSAAFINECAVRRRMKAEAEQVTSDE